MILQLKIMDQKFAKALKESGKETDEMNMHQPCKSIKTNLSLPGHEHGRCVSLNPEYLLVLVTMHH